MEYNPEAGELVPLATLFLLQEGERRPGLFFGTSSDRIGSPEGTQSYYLTLAKAHPRFPISGYVSLNYSEWDGGFNVPFGVALELPRGFTVKPMYDGQRSHLVVSYDRGPVSVSLLYVWLERFGLAFSIGI